MLDTMEKQLCFAAICEAGTITGAAALLQRSKGHVSKQLTLFEKSLGTRLFHRTTRSMELTAAGEQLRTEAVQLLRQSRILQMRSRDLGGDLTGRFVITAPASVGLMLLGPAFPEIQAAFPRIHFDLRITNQNLDLIREGIDLGFRCGDVLDPDLVARPVGTSREVLCASQSYLQAQKPLVAPEDLSGHRLLLNPYSLTEENLLISKEDQTQTVRTSQAQFADHFAVISDWVMAGLGIGVVPDYCFQKIAQNGEVVRVLPRWSGKALPFWMIYPLQTPMPQKLRKVSQFVLQFLERAISLPSERFA